MNSMKYDAGDFIVKLLGFKLHPPGVSLVEKWSVPGGGRGFHFAFSFQYLLDNKFSPLYKPAG